MLRLKFINKKSFNYSAEEENEESEDCPSAGYLTVFDGGRLGNQMSQYATLFAHANRFGVPAVISSKMKDKLSAHFPNFR